MIDARIERQHAAAKAVMPNWTSPSVDGNDDEWLATLHGRVMKQGD